MFNCSMSDLVSLVYCTGKFKEIFHEKWDPTHWKIYYEYVLRASTHICYITRHLNRKLIRMSCWICRNSKWTSTAPDVLAQRDRERERKYCLQLIMAFGFRWKKRIKKTEKKNPVLLNLYWFWLLENLVENRMQTFPWVGWGEGVYRRICDFINFSVHKIVWHLLTCEKRTWRKEWTHSKV